MATYSDEDTAELRASIGAKMRSRRHELKLNQIQAGVWIGKCTEFYARLERGQALPSVPTLKSIADGLGLSADHLLGLDDERPPMDLPSYKDPRRIDRIVARARNDNELLRVLIMVLKMCDHGERP